MQKELRPTEPIQIKTLREAVELEYACSLRSRVRRRNYVNGRMTFAYILRKRGFTVASIGFYMGRDHSSIVHYLKNIEWYLKTDVQFRTTFEKVFTEFHTDEHSIFLMGNDELKKELITCRHQLKELNLEIEGLKKQQAETKKVSKRIEALVDVVTQRTRSGFEDETLKKLNIFYNGL
tara:strand:- start:14687 stop:15220 length:534 start_codon:yes stop_codon:yes gene_type:complete